MVVGLWRVGHGRLQEGLVISPGLDELLVQLREVVFLLGVLLDQLDKLWPDSERLVIEFLENS